MMTLLVPLFYLWLATTILLAAMFFLHRHDLRRSRDDEELISQPNLDPVAEPDPIPEDTTDEDTTDDADGETADMADTADTAETASDQHDPVDSDAEIADSEANGAHSGECPPIVELLQGATLPHDLTLATERIADPDRHAILISPNSDAEMVGTAFADELAGMGFVIEPVGLDKAKAVRDDQVLMMKICPNAGIRGSGGYRRYPTADDTDVAIEIWTGQDSPPRLAR